MKKCKACGKDKPEAKFYPTRHGGLLGVCKKCRAKQVVAARRRLRLAERAEIRSRSMSSTGTVR